MIFMCLVCSLCYEYEPNWAVFSASHRSEHRLLRSAPAEHGLQEQTPDPHHSISNPARADDPVQVLLQSYLVFKRVKLVSCLSS